MIIGRFLFMVCGTLSNFEILFTNFRSSGYYLLPHKARYSTNNILSIEINLVLVNELASNKDFACNQNAYHIYE